MKKQQIDLRGSVCVIGGGAAGLMSACVAAENGAQVVIFEKNISEKKLASEEFFDNAYLGKKLLITGKGRCNLTNDCDRENFMKNIPCGGKFLFAAYTAFPPAAVINFFEAHGLPLKKERGNRVFPASDKALDVLKTLKAVIKNHNVRVVNKKAAGIFSDGEKITGFSDSEGNEYIADSVIVCTGGMSYPITGSDGDGYRFARSLGHTVTELRPSLVPIVSDDIFCKRLQGLALKNVKLSLKNNVKKKTVYSELGEMLFTHFGVSGPLVLSASAHIEDNPADYSLHIDLKPALDEKTLDSRLLSEFAENLNKSYKNVLSALLPSKLVPVFAELSGIPAELKVNSITKQQRHAVISLLKDFKISVCDFRPIDEAVITRGGVKTSEINPSTMESKKIKGLYFAGEIIDADGYTGGFNLQISFSTAFLAGKTAAEAAKPKK